ncbi:UNVERIFIED_CONTAM: Polygalacturonase [Sesamum indicum]
MIVSGCSDVRIYNVNCGPGHGYSIGGLGPNKTQAQVSDIVVFNSTVQDSLTGVRIKTWRVPSKPTSLIILSHSVTSCGGTSGKCCLEKNSDQSYNKYSFDRLVSWTLQGGYGSVHDIRFSNITVTNVKTPITIDQNYCGDAKICNCTNDTNAVAITSVAYENITGTYTSISVSLNCSEYKPCRNLTVAIIDIVASEGSRQGGGDKEGAPYCKNAYGRVLTNTSPPLQDCLLPEAAVPMPPQAVGYLF